ncbi:MAG TPA: lamin tail domain-containing protein [Kofleriaceae bacterium]|nr:lamin tail domain-containing protein [Kofleriaceae bacterium]
MKAPAATFLLLLAACASGRYRPEGDDDDDVTVDAAPAVDAAAGTTDAASVPTDAPAPDAPPAMVAPLLLSEVALAPNSSEMIELYNPTSAPVALRNFYLSDVPTYFRLPGGSQTVEASDFIARFPSGATIPAHGVVVVALDTTANFTTATGTAPTYSIGSATMELVGGSASTLTNTGEPVVLFYWDGTSDRVTDVDVMLAGMPSAANALVNKSGVTIDGPDADSSGAAYVTDAMTITGQSPAPGSALSTKRVALETAGTEAQTGAGNGVLGQDETSEQTQTTWDSSAYTALTPGSVPTALVN